MGRWRTDIPTEEGWYLIRSKGVVPFRVAYYKSCHWLSDGDTFITADTVMAWQRIDPYDGIEPCVNFVIGASTDELGTNYQHLYFT